MSWDSPGEIFGVRNFTDKVERVGFILGSDSPFTRRQGEIIFLGMLAAMAGEIAPSAVTPFLSAICKDVVGGPRSSWYECSTDEMETELEKFVESLSLAGRLTASKAKAEGIPLKPEAPLFCPMDPHGRLMLRVFAAAAAHYAGLDDTDQANVNPIIDQFSDAQSWTLLHVDIKLLCDRIPQSERIALPTKIPQQNNPSGCLLCLTAAIGILAIGIFAGIRHGYYIL